MRTGIGTLLRYYAAYGANSLPKFRDNLSGPKCWYYQHTLSNILDERRSFYIAAEAGYQTYRLKGQEIFKSKSNVGWELHVWNSSFV
jgi:hypothetical protein